jgi:hypothetical protein
MSIIIKIEGERVIAQRGDVVIEKDLLDIVDEC